MNDRRLQIPDLPDVALPTLLKNNDLNYQVSVPFRVCQTIPGRGEKISRGGSP
jgi:hypothetical protein